MYRLKKVAFRFSATVAVLGLLGSTFAAALMPIAANADALNPLTQRSLTLSSSSPGWSYTDGSGDPWDISCYPAASGCAPGYSPYAYPGSGANGKQTGETFSFRISTPGGASGASTNVKALTFQYCTTSAGLCEAPGNDTYTGSTRNGDTATTSDLNVVTSSPSEMDSSDAGTAFNLTNAAVDGVAPGDAFGNTEDNYSIVPPDNSEGNFVVLTKDVGADHWTYSTGWSMSASNVEDSSYSISAGTATGKNNFITLKNDGTGALDLGATGEVKVVFAATNTNYIVNPGGGPFFVKINDFNDTDYQNSGDNFPVSTGGSSGSYTCGSAAAPNPATNDCPANVIDGGVTVANVMNQSIQIETKVLETMDFSVGTVDPDTLDASDLDAANGHTTHGTCDPILTSMTPSTGAQNFLLLGDQDSESSLSTTHTYGTYSYFRLSSNSTGGATVYYSGATLSDTEGDQIQAIGTTATQPIAGSPQFGLALDNAQISGSTNYPVNYSYNTKADGDVNPDGGGNYENGDDNFPAGVDASFTSDTHLNGDVHNPQLYPLVPASAYGGGSGTFDAYVDGSSTSFPVNTTFAFDPTANSVPAVLASESTHVVDCVTGKVRYIANIAATTPAGIFTTKINYIASPQY